MPMSEFHEKLGSRGSNKGKQFNESSGTNKSTFQSGDKGSWQGKASAPKVEDTKKD
jgi:hypothetical protein